MAVAVPRTTNAKDSNTTKLMISASLKKSKMASIWRPKIQIYAIEERIPEALRKGK